MNSWETSRTSILLCAGLFLASCTWHSALDSDRDSMSAARHLELGTGYEEKGDFESARIHYQAAVDKEPGLAAWVSLGNAYSRLKEYDKAEQLYRQALTGDPGHAMANNNLAWILIVQGKDFPEAERLIRTAMYSDPRRVSVYLDTMAHLYLRQRRFEEALQNARAAENNLDLGDAALREQIEKTRSLIVRAMHLAGEDELIGLDQDPDLEVMP